MFPWRNARSTPSTVSAVVVTVPAKKFCVLTSAQFLATLPKVNVSLISGIIFEFTSALNTILSVSASPIVMLPSAVILPVATMLPVTLVFPNISTVPVPLGLNSIFVLVSFVLITLFSKVKLSTINLF
jgi:hypothetical protein